MLKQDGGYMTHEHKLLSFMLDALNWVYHTNIFAHLESCLGIVKLKIFEALLSKTLEELQAHFSTGFWDLNTILIFVKSKTLQEIS